VILLVSLALSGLNCAGMSMLSIYSLSLMAAFIVCTAKMWWENSETATVLYRVWCYRLGCCALLLL